MANGERGGYPSALAGRLGFLLARAHLVMREQADVALAKFGLDARAFAALATLVSNGPVSQQTLSRRLRLDPATMVDVIDSLERSGLLVRKRNPQDRREYALQTTAKGRAVFARADRALTSAEAETLAGMSSEQTQLLVRLLGRIAEASSTPATPETLNRVLGR